MQSADIVLSPGRWGSFPLAIKAALAVGAFLLRCSLADPGPQTQLSLYDLAADGASLPPRALRRLGLPFLPALLHPDPHDTLLPRPGH